MLTNIESTERFKEFFSEHEKKLLATVASENNTITLDFSELSSFDPKLAIDLLEHPTEILKAAERSITEIDFPAFKKINIGITNLPKTYKHKISELRVSHLGKFVCVEGIIRQKSPTIPKSVLIKFECANCGNTITIVQDEDIVKQPKQCGCGKKSGFRPLNKEQVDFQIIQLEEPIEEVTAGDRGERKRIILEGNLAKPSEQSKYVPGNKVAVNGIFTEVIKWKKRGGTSGQSTTSETVIVANSVQQSETVFENIKTDTETEQKIIEVSNNPKLFELLREAVAPTIYGFHEAKLSIVLQLFGGIRTNLPDDVSRRGEIHLLLVGDPGSGKSVLVKRATMLHPKSRFAVGTSATGVGITAAVVKDDVLGGFTAEAGPIVLANHGLLGLDEIGNMHPEDLSKLQESLEQGVISLDKGNVHEKLPAETSVLAAGNPKFGRFDAFGNVADEIGLTPQLISRFDLIFAIQDSKTTQKDDEALADKIIRVHIKAQDEDFAKNPFSDVKFFRSYVAYASRNITPILSEEASEYLKQSYITLRNKCRNNAQMKGVTARELEGMIRLSEASAKARLSDVVTVEDVERAVNLKFFCWRQLGFDPESGTVDVDKIFTGMAGSKRDKCRKIYGLLDVKEQDAFEISKAAEKSFGINPLEFDELIEVMKREGKIYEPRHGRIVRLP